MSRSGEMACGRFQVRLLAGVFSYSLFLLCGCGSSNSPSGDSPVSQEPKPAAESKRRVSEEGGASVSTNGPKSIGDIPLDVFFDKPLVIAANTQSGAVAGSNDVAATKMSPPSGGPSDAASVPKETSKDPAGGTASAKDLIEKDALANEIKSVRIYLAGKSSLVSTYNASYLEIPPEASTLAVLAVAVARHPEDFSWKKNAKHVRELAGKIAELTASKDAKSKNTFEAVAEAFSKIDDILNGTEPAGLADADDDKDYGDAVGGSLVMLMKRVKKSEEILKANVSSEAGLKKEADKVAQEGAVLAFMGQIIITEGFGFGGDAEFAQYAKPLTEGGKLLMEAAKSGNYSLYDEGITKVSKSCNDCHPKFKP